MINPWLKQQQQAPLLSEIDDLIRTIPPRQVFCGEGQQEALAWLGRAGAAIEAVDVAKGPEFDLAAKDLRDHRLLQNTSGHSAISVLLHQVRSMLRLELSQLSSVIASGEVFNYFDELRKLVEGARVELLFVDPYLDADFVSRYLPYVASGVSTRLLCGAAKLDRLLPAIDMLVPQKNAVIEVRFSHGLHDRFLFVDRRDCYQSSASFKDGGKNAPALIAPLVDSFRPMWDLYEGIWKNAKRQRPLDSNGK